ncbi:hypothetical protein F5141DRAFT_393260 [Pisolithus sp. B1]|nr:hypothetical protein F5141DRAFT_393260 [Pisolithus sp. B1]
MGTLAMIILSKITPMLLWPIYSLLRNALETYVSCLVHKASFSPFVQQLYDALASAYDGRLHFGAEVINPVDRCKCPPSVGREPLRRMAAHHGNSPDYLGLGWEYPGWCPRRSSYEERRGAVAVTLAEVCSISHTVEPLPTSDQCENAAAVYPSDEERLEGLDDHVSDVEDEMDFEFASDGTFDASNANVVPPGLLQLPPDCNSAFDSKPHDAVRTTCTKADAKNMNHREWKTPCASEGTPRLLENASGWIRSETQFSGPVLASESSSAMPASTLPCAENLSTGNQLYQGGTAKKPSAAKSAPKKAGRTEDTARISITAIGQPVIDTPRTVTTQSLHMSSVRDAPSRALPSGQEPVFQESVLDDDNEHAVQPTQVPPRAKQNFPCVLDGCKQVCSSAGDLMRHQQSLRHRPPQYFCSGCEYGFTRPDALKRHLNNKPRCRAVHRTVTSTWLRGPGDAEGSSPTS